MYVVVSDVALQRLREAGKLGYSGHWGHKGRPGKKGGSLPKDSSASYLADKVKYSAMYTGRGDFAGDSPKLLEAIKEGLRKVPAEWGEGIVEIEITDDHIDSGVYYCRDVKELGGKPFRIVVSPLAFPHVLGEKFSLDYARGLIAHEVAHHFWFEHMDTKEGARFEEWWKLAKQGRIKVPRAYSKESPWEFFSTNFQAWVMGDRHLVDEGVLNWFDTYTRPKNVSKSIRYPGGLKNKTPGELHWESVQLEYGVAGRSGHWGHKSEPGKRGGSLPKGGGGVSPKKVGPIAPGPKVFVTKSFKYSKLGNKKDELVRHIRGVIKRVPEDWSREVSIHVAFKDEEEGNWGEYMAWRGGGWITIYPGEYADDIRWIDVTRETLAHELAHNAWEHHLSADDRKFFTDIHKEAVVASRKGEYFLAPRAYALKNREEYFCVSFEEYFIGRAKYMAPRVREWFEKHIKLRRVEVESVLEYGVRGRSGHWGHKSQKGRRGGSLPKDGQPPTSPSPPLSGGGRPINKDDRYASWISKEDDEKITSYVQNYVRRIPEEWSRNVRIDFTGASIEHPYWWGEYEYGDVGGVAIVRPEAIYNDRNSTLDAVYGVEWQENVAIVVAHEIAHDAWYRLLSDEDKRFFDACFVMSGKTLKIPRDHGRKNVKEFFCVNFEAWVAGKAYMMESAIVEWFEKNVRPKLPKESIDEYGVKGRSGHWGHTSVKGHRGGSAPKGASKGQVPTRFVDPETGQMLLFVPNRRTSYVRRGDTAADYEIALTDKAKNLLSDDQQKSLNVEIRKYLGKIPKEWADGAEIHIQTEGSYMGEYVHGINAGRIQVPPKIYVNISKMQKALGPDDPWMPFGKPCTWEEWTAISLGHEIGHHFFATKMSAADRAWFTQLFSSRNGRNLKIPRSYGEKNAKEFFAVSVEAWLAGEHQLLDERVVAWFKKNIGRLSESIAEMGVRGKSGHWGHAGIPGHKGGSLPGKGNGAPKMKSPKEPVTLDPKVTFSEEFYLQFSASRAEKIKGLIKKALDEVPPKWVETVNKIEVIGDKEILGGGRNWDYTGWYEPWNRIIIVRGGGFPGADATLLHEFGHHFLHSFATAADLTRVERMYDQAVAASRRPGEVGFRYPREYSLLNPAELFTTSLEVFFAFDTGRGENPYVDEQMANFIREVLSRRYESVDEMGVRGKSGHWRHSGRPGKRGGSLPKDASETPYSVRQSFSKWAMQNPDHSSRIENAIRSILLNIPSTWVAGATITLDGDEEGKAGVGRGYAGVYDDYHHTIVLNVAYMKNELDLYKKIQGRLGLPSLEKDYFVNTVRESLAHEISHHYWFTKADQETKKLFTRLHDSAKKGLSEYPRPYALESVSEFFSCCYEVWATAGGNSEKFINTIPLEAVVWFDENARVRRVRESINEMGVRGKSGHWGHKGRPGERGGSLPGKSDGGLTPLPDRKEFLRHGKPHIVGGTAKDKAVLRNLLSKVPAWAKDGLHITIGKLFSGRDRGAEFDPFLKRMRIEPKILRAEFFTNFEVSHAYAQAHPKAVVWTSTSYGRTYDLKGDRVTDEYRLSVFLHEVGHHVYYRLGDADREWASKAFADVYTPTIGSYAWYWKDREDDPRTWGLDQDMEKARMNRQMRSERFAEAFRLYVMRGKFKREFAKISKIKESIDEASKFVQIAALSPIRRAFTSIQSVLSGNVLNRSEMYRQSVDMINRAMSNYQSAIDNLVSDLETGKLTPDQALERFKVTAENSYQVAFLAGGFRAGNPFYRDLGITPEDLTQVVGSRDFESGFWANFQQDIKNQDYSRQRVADRAKMYGDAIYSQYWDGYVAGLPDTTEIAWVMGDAEHCEDCQNIAANSPYTRATLPTVPRAGDTRCLSNCKCRIFEIVNEDVLTSKMLPPKVGMSRGELYGMNPVEVYQPSGEAAPAEVTAMLAGIYAEINRLRQLIELDEANLTMYVAARKRAVQQAMDLAMAYNVRVVPKYSVGELVAAVQGMVDHGWELARSGGAVRVGQMVREVRSVFINAGMVTSVTGDTIHVMTPRGELVINIPESLVFFQGE